MTNIFRLTRVSAFGVHGFSRMMNGLLLAVICLLWISPAQAQTPTTPAAVKPGEEWREKLEARVFEKDGKKLPYRLLTPSKIEPGKKYPLLLFLHGAGERGADNNNQLQWSVGDVLKLTRGKQEFFMIVPQCPANSEWAVEPGILNMGMGPDGKRLSITADIHPTKPSPSLAMALQVVDKISAEQPVDQKRLYVAGLSMGGYGTWMCIETYPDKFAAAIPVCGGGNPEWAGKLMKIPIWAFHGAKDPIVPTDCTRNIINAITKAGGQPKYTEYPEEGHGAWRRTFNNPEVIDWLFAQAKK